MYCICMEEEVGWGVGWGWDGVYVCVYCAIILNTIIRNANIYIFIIIKQMQPFDSNKYSFNCK